jgi:hypothetical protein
MKAIAFLAAIVILLGSFYSSSLLAQTPTVQIYFDEALQVKHRRCPDAQPGTILDTLYIVAHNFNAQIIDIEYLFHTYGNMAYAGDLLPAGYTAIGFSVDGIVVSFPAPVYAGSTLLIQGVMFWWTCRGCPYPDYLIWIEPHPMSGKVQATRWPDLGKIEGMGRYSWLCPVVPVEQKTWGGIKALYR